MSSKFLLLVILSMGVFSGAQAMKKGSVKKTKSEPIAQKPIDYLRLSMAAGAKKTVPQQKASANSVSLTTSPKHISTKE